MREYSSSSIVDHPLDPPVIISPSSTSTIDYLQSAADDSDSPFSSSSSSPSSNITRTDSHGHYYHLQEVPHTLTTIVVLSTLVILVVGCTLIGNTLVCMAVGLVRKLRKQAANYLLVSLAVADLCVGFVVMPMAFLYLILGRWPFGQFLCEVWTYADVTLCTASILNLCVISVDRYLAIVRPLSYCPKRTGRRMCVYISIVWIGAILVSFLPPIAFLSSSMSENGICEVSQNAVYQVYATMCAFYIPATIILVVNYKIYKAARRLTLADKRASAFTKGTATSTTMVAAAAVFMASASSATRGGSGRKASQQQEFNNNGIDSMNREETNRSSSSSFSIRNLLRSPRTSIFNGGGSRGGRKRKSTGTTTTESGEMKSNSNHPVEEDEGRSSDCSILPNHQNHNNNNHIAADAASVATRHDTPRRSRTSGSSIFRHFSFRNRLKPGNDRRSFSKHLTEAFISRSVSHQNHRSSSSASNWERFHIRERNFSTPLSASSYKRRKRSDWIRGSSTNGGNGMSQRPSRLRQHQYSSSTETKAMKTLGLIMGCFIACWLPFFVVALLKALCPVDIPFWVDSTVLWLGYANSTFNPILYAKYNKDFRIPFREMLCCRFRTLKSVLRMEEYMDTFGSIPSSLDGMGVTVPATSAPTAFSGVVIQGEPSSAVPSSPIARTAAQATAAALLTHRQSHLDVLGDGGGMSAVGKSRSSPAALNHESHHHQQQRSPPPHPDTFL